jgi:DTW domain-containing protein YfiP
MAHLSMKNSHLVIGKEFEGHARVERLLHREDCSNVMLYPRADAKPLDDVLAASRERSGKRLVLWVLDAKWSQVPKMLRLSPAVRDLPATAFKPEQASRFRIRRQPDAACLSTVEAIHAVLERQRVLADSEQRDHDGMIEVFKHLVSQQLGFCDWQSESRHAAACRRRKERAAARQREALARAEG